MLFLRYLQHALMDFLQTFVASASWDRDELVGFCSQKVKGQGPNMTKFPVGGGIQRFMLCVEFYPSNTVI